MKTKNYRAATMREALEKVKQELGEEALVLDSKRVRAGGFLGLGATELIEVRVAADDLPVEKRGRSAGQSSPQMKSVLTSLNLSDDTPATPALDADFNERKSNNTFAALAARTYTNRAIAPATERKQDEETSFVGVEVATTAPRIVHRKNISSTTAQASAAVTATETSSTQNKNQSSSDLERLRAELREVKFALNAFSSRAFMAGNMSNATSALDG